MDFAKAFDSVPHYLLLKKLMNYGNLYIWIKSYVSNRKQRVFIDGYTYEWLPVISGVPQDSILGPVMFIMYVNDLPSVVKSSHICLYADHAKMYMNIDSITDCKKL